MLPWILVLCTVLFLSSVYPNCLGLTKECILIQVLKHVKIIYNVLYIDLGHWCHANRLQGSHIIEETRNLCHSDFRILVRLTQPNGKHFTDCVTSFFLVQTAVYQTFEVNYVTIFVLEIINLKIRSKILCKWILLEIFSNFILKVLHPSFSLLLGHNTKSRTWEGKNLLEVSWQK